MQNLPPPALTTVRAGVLDGALRPRVVGLAESMPGPAWFALLLESGRAVIADEDMPVIGPALAWRPWPRGARAKFAAGATGGYALLGATALANAVGYMPEARELREMADRAITAPLSGQPGPLRTLRFSFAGLSLEVGATGAAARVAVEAYLRLALVEVYRAGQSQLGASDGASPAHRSFTRFSELVEIHFRDRWSVADYASTLGMSRDRLGDICQRVRGLGPKEIIDRRVAVEARLLLRNSSNSIQQIAALLGFSSAPQFSRFFKRTTGLPPGHYRSEYATDANAGTRDPVLPYEWP